MTTDYIQMSDRITTTSTYVASGAAIVFGLTVNEIAALTGVFIAFATFILNAWFKIQHLNLAKEKIRLLKEEEESDGDI